MGFGNFLESAGKHRFIIFVVSCTGPPISPEGRVLEVRVSDCTKLPCSFIIDQSYTLEIDFIPCKASPLQ